MVLLSPSFLLTTLGLFISAAAAIPTTNVVRDSTVKLPTKKSLHVDGKHIPGISNHTGDLGSSYAGLLPVTSDPSDDKKLFFWYWPTDEDAGKDDLVIWLNGGPGCSSLEGLFEENGPFKISEPSKGVYEVKKNKYSWHHLSNVLWIEQPVSVGLGTGKPDISGEVGLSREFYAFLQNFYKTFPEVKSKKLWLTGESYAGQYIPYIADYIYKQDDTLNLQGIAVNDPSIVNDDFGGDIPALDFAKEHQKTLRLSKTDISRLEKAAKRNNIVDFVEKNLVFPPKGKIYAPKELMTGDVFDRLYTYASNKNPCFSVYTIDSVCPGERDPLGFPLDVDEPSAKNFINRTPGFKKYVHAPVKKTWLECTTGDVFISNGGDDKSPAPADTDLLGRVITKNKRTVIQHGLRDMVLMANGTLLGIQNTTWSDAGSGGSSQALQGFQTNFFNKKGNLKVNGKSTGQFLTERGLTFASIDKAGHMIPQFTPATAFKLQKFLLGQISEAELSTD